MGVLVPVFLVSVWWLSVMAQAVIRTAEQSATDWHTATRISCACLE